MSNVFDRMAAQNEKNDSEQEPTSPERNTRHVQIVNETKTTPVDVKKALQELLRNGLIDQASKPELFQRVIQRQREILAALEPLDLSVQLDDHRGVAFLVVAETSIESLDHGEEWHHPLVRRQRLTLEQSLLVALLRQAFVMHEQDVGVGYSAARVSVDDLLSQLRVYWGESGSDTRDDHRVAKLLEQLKVHGIVSEVDQSNEVIIRPLIAHLTNPESLSALLDCLRQQSEAQTSSREESHE